MQKSIKSALNPVLKLTHEEQFIIKCLWSEFCKKSKNESFKIDIDFSIINWNTAYEKSVKWHIAPLLYRIIEKQTALLQFSSVPRHFLQKLEITNITALITNKASFNSLMEVLKVFNKVGIKVILLKGSHLAQFIYKDIGLRDMVDIDILVRKEDLNKTEGLLFKMGYNFLRMTEDTIKHANSIEMFKHNCHHLHPFIHPKGIKHLEIHWAIANPKSPFNIDIEGLWNRAKSVKVNGTDVFVFSPEDLLLHLSLHTSYQHKLMPYNLRPYCDIATTIDHHTHEIDWDQIRLRAYEWGIEKYLYLTLRLSQEILGASVPDSILHDLKPKLFNEKIVLEARKRILYMENKKPAFKGMNYSAKIHIFHPEDSLLKKVSFFLKRIFISSEELASRYSLPSSSKRVYFYHIVRFLSLLYNYTRLYVPYFLYRLIHKKEQHCDYNLDLWLTH